MSFKTQKEVWEALISQKKITYREWINSFLQLDTGFIVDADGDRCVAVSVLELASKKEST
jgi:phosphomannomutase